MTIKNEQETAGRIPAATIAGLAVLAGIVFSLALVLHAHAVNGRNGFPLDDPWIHLTYARNLHDHHTFAYFPGDPSTQGSTSPLYTFLLSLGFTFTRNEKILSYVLGILFQTLFLAAFWFWARRRLGSDLWAAAGTILIGLSANIGILSVSGMETSLFLFTVALAFLARAERRNRLLGIALALAVWTRPDALILVVAFGLDALAGVALAGGIGTLPASTARSAGAPGTEPGTARPATTWRPFLEAAIPLGVLLAAYGVFNLIVGGGLLPNTFAAKTAYYRNNPRGPFLVNDIGGLFLSGAGLLLVPFALLSIGREAMRLLGRARANQDRANPDRASSDTATLRAEAAWVIGLPLAYLLLMPFAHRFQRYLVPALPAIVVLGLSGMQMAARFLTRAMNDSAAKPGHAGKAAKAARPADPATSTAFSWTSRAGIAAGVLLIAALALQVRSTFPAATGYAELCKYHYVRHERTGLWLAANTPANAVIATHDVGAIAYYSGRKVVDIMGVVLPEAVSHVNTPGYFEYLRDLFARQKVTHLAVLRNWIEVVNVEPLFTADPKPEVLEVFPWNPGRTHFVPEEPMWLEGHALDLMRSGDLGGAARMLQRSISLDPEDSRSWFLLGVTQESGRRVAEAETSYRRALSLYPEFADAQVRLAAVLAASGRSAASRAIVTALLARKPGYPGAAELLRQIGS